MQNKRERKKKREGEGQKIGGGRSSLSSWDAYHPKMKTFLNKLKVTNFCHYVYLNFSKN